MFCLDHFKYEIMRITAKTELVFFYKINGKIKSVIFFPYFRLVLKEKRRSLQKDEVYANIFHIF